MYRTTPEWERIKLVAAEYFSCKSAMYHYYGTANKNYHEYLLDDMVKYKKYFYVLRPLLACKWIEEKKCPPPVLFGELADTVLGEGMKPLVKELIEKKIKMAEAEKGKRIDELNEYILKKLEDFKAKAERMEDDRTGDWEKLNRLFIGRVRKGEG